MDLILGLLLHFLWCFREREKILDLFEITCGARLLYNYIWVGGVSHDLPSEFGKKLKDFLKTFPKALKEINDLLTFNKIFIDRTANVGVLPACSGPMLRGSGVKFDLRKNEPYLVYDRFEFDIPVGEGKMGTVGDCWDRYYVRVREMEESLKIIEQAWEQLPPGDVHSAIPKKVRPPQGEVYFRTEN
ncbi:Respiratory-chain NADH dehydrogenase, subunit, partial [Candidatus Kryptonium thompsonii]